MNETLLRKDQPVRHADLGCLWQHTSISTRAVAVQVRNGLRSLTDIDQSFLRFAEVRLQCLQVACSRQPPCAAGRKHPQRQTAITVPIGEAVRLAPAPTAPLATVRAPAEAAAETQRLLRRRYCGRCWRSSLQRQAATPRLNMATMASSGGNRSGLRSVIDGVVLDAMPESLS
jgi:hypothetical protein